MGTCSESEIEKVLSDAELVAQDKKLTPLKRLNLINVAVRQVADLLKKAQKTCPISGEVLVSFQKREIALRNHTMELDGMVANEAHRIEEVADQRSKLIGAMKMHSNEAGYACENFFTSIETGDIEGAKAYMAEIGKLEGEIPQMVQEAFAEAVLAFEK